MQLFLLPGEVSLEFLCYKLFMRITVFKNYVLFGSIRKEFGPDKPFDFINATPYFYIT